MTEDDQNIIENTTSGRKPRRKPKDVTKGEPDFHDLFQISGQDHLQVLFDKDDISMTNQRLYNANDGEFKLEDLEVQWNKIALFHKAVVPIDRFVFRMVEYGSPPSRYLKILTDQRLEYYLKPPSDYYRDVMVKLSMPQHGEDFLNSSNKYINEYIEGLSGKAAQFNLAIVPLNGNTPQRKGLYIPMMRTDSRLEQDFQSKFANVFQMKYDAREEGIDYFHLKSLKNEMEVKRFIQNTLQKWRNKK